MTCRRHAIWFSKVTPLTLPIDLISVRKEGRSEREFGSSRLVLQSQDDSICARGFVTSKRIGRAGRAVVTGVGVVCVNIFRQTLNQIAG